MTTGGFLLGKNPDTVRVPYLAFATYEWLDRQTGSGYFDGPPQLVVEIFSPTDRITAIAKKAREWAAAGARLTWVWHPYHRTVTVYRPGQEPQELGTGDVLSGEDVLPGFECPVEDLFPPAIVGKA